MDAKTITNKVDNLELNVYNFNALDSLLNKNDNKILSGEFLGNLVCTLC